MKIFESLARERLANSSKEGIAVRFVGQRERFSETLQDAMRKVEKKKPQ